MIPPRIKKLPNLHKPVGFVKKPQQGSVHSNRSLNLGTRKSVN